MPQVNPSRYAKIRGCSAPAVFDAIKKGRLVNSVQALENGRYLIDVDQANAEWVANTDAGTGSLAHASKRPVMMEIDTKAEPDSDEPITYAEARAQHERFKARLAQLELEQREGKLVEADIVKREAFRVARLVRDALLNLPDRVAGELAAETNQFKIHQRLTAEIRRALEDLKIE